ncbi:DUF6332 family protein, partial [Streptomyces paradoxus]|uniref:DUF6332 family protein n=1 Tax=Streptomyces paradoxus TaxID=66375 RepID=UPI00362B6C8B
PCPPGAPLFGSPYDQPRGTRTQAERERLLPGAGLMLAPVLFAARAVSVLVRFRTAGQPSQPGRTSPDS